MSGSKAGDGSARAAQRDARTPLAPVEPSSPLTEEDPHEKETVVPPYDVESYAKMASELPVPVTRSVSVMVNRAALLGAPAQPPRGVSSTISIPPPPTVRRPEVSANAKGILDDPSALRRIPMRVISGERLQNSMLDHREGFVLSLVDGQLDIEAIVDVCGMPENDVLEILENLRISGVIQLD